MHEIPLVDVQAADLSSLLLDSAHADRVKALIAASRKTLGIYSQIASYALLPLSDRIAKRWLKKTNNPYLPEIQKIAQVLNIAGIYGLNLSYEWGCTSGVFRTESGLRLHRVLDWPFPELGKHIIVAKQQAATGIFYNITWPGLSGTFNGLAPNRFAAALNLAPMRLHNRGIILDWLRNRKQMYQQNALPPAHLLRKVFETATDYNQAKLILSTEPISVPAIYILSGTKNDEGCVIERLENDAAIREIGTQTRVVATNHFQSHFNGHGNGWMPRPIDSQGRFLCMNNLEINSAAMNLNWFIRPIANELCRLVMVADAGTGDLIVQGVEGKRPVTHLLQI